MLPYLASLKLKLFKHEQSTYPLVFCIIFRLLAVQYALMAFAQHGDISINGKVTEMEDGQPVRQTSVSIAHKGIGTSTNTAGMLALMIPAFVSFSAKVIIREIY
jgi:hypothetical protein